MSKRITINLPYESKLLKYNRFRGSRIKSFRLYDDEFDLILKSSKLLGITPNYFIRYCSVCIAKKFLRKRKSYIEEK